MLDSSLSLSDRSIGATNVAASYNFSYSNTLTTGDAIILSLPGWAGTPVTSSACGGPKTFNISASNNGTVDYKITIVSTNAIVGRTHCNILIQGLINPQVPVAADKVLNKITAASWTLAEEPIKSFTNLEILKSSISFSLQLTRGKWCDGKNTNSQIIILN